MALGRPAPFPGSFLPHDRTGGVFVMPRILTNLKFWGLTAALTWIVLVIAVIAKNPEFAYGPR
ncbi:hypothetical protein GCM10027521_20130 [Amycolatopsis cihanbeyliensis]